MDKNLTEYDFNSYEEVGVYSLYQDNGANLKNSPISQVAGGFNLIVLNHGEDGRYTEQMFKPYKTNDIWIRRKYWGDVSTEWSSWERVVTNSDLEPLFSLKVVKNTITYNNLFYRLQQIIIQGTGVDTYTVEIQAFVDGVFCNRLHVGGGVQEFWTPETNVVIQYGYNDESLCPHNINIVACKINWNS